MSSLVERLQAKFAALIVAADLDAIDPSVEVTPEGLPEVARYLKQESDLNFDGNVDFIDVLIVLGSRWTLSGRLLVDEGIPLRAFDLDLERTEQALQAAFARHVSGLTEEFLFPEGLPD